MDGQGGRRRCVYECMLLSSLHPLGVGSGSLVCRKRCCDEHSTFLSTFQIFNCALSRVSSRSFIVVLSPTSFLDSKAFFIFRSCATTLVTVKTEGENMVQFFLVR